MTLQLVGLNIENMEGRQEVPLEDFTVGSLPTLLYIPNFITESEQAQLLHHIYEVPASRWKSLKNRRLQNWGGVVHEKGLLPQDSLSQLFCAPQVNPSDKKWIEMAVHLKITPVHLPSRLDLGLSVPPWLTKITQRICRQTGLFPSPINHVLINEYLPDQGIMPHQDGPAYFPVVAILSLESPVVIDFTPHPRLKECTNTEKITAKSLTTTGTASEGEAKGSLDELVGKPDNNHEPCSLLLMPCSLLIFKDQAYADYLHGIQDSELHRVDKVLNISECLKLRDQKLTSSNSEEQNNGLCRTSTRVSLTCRLVMKVHKNLFKF